jgi:hypothetical protein
MTERSVAHLHLEVDLDREPIAGVLHHGDRESTPFSGWMELSRTIELSIDQARRGGSGTHGTPRPWS